MVELYLHIPLRLHAVMRNYSSETLFLLSLLHEEVISQNLQKTAPGISSTSAE
jgi:hypothetical protein